MGTYDTAGGYPLSPDEDCPEVGNYSIVTIDDRPDRERKHIFKNVVFEEAPDHWVFWTEKGGEIKRRKDTWKKPVLLEEE